MSAHKHCWMCRNARIPFGSNSDGEGCFGWECAVKRFFCGSVPIPGAWSSECQNYNCSKFNMESLCDKKASRCADCADKDHAKWCPCAIRIVETMQTNCTMTEGRDAYCPFFAARSAEEVKELLEGLRPGSFAKQSRGGKLRAWVKSAAKFCGVEVKPDEVEGVTE